MKIQLSEHFTYKKLLRFVLPSIVMMIFTSIYGVVDGLFVSNYVGKTAFAAVNLIMPFLMAISALGFMIGTGGSAIVAKTLGEGKKEQANEYFSMLVYLTLIGGIVLSALGILFSPLIARGLGADGALLTNCVLYARITLLSMPAFMLQNVFQSFFVTAEKPKLGLGVIVIAGVTNMVLDFLLVGVFQIGLAGAAFATVTSECIGGLFPILYFARRNSSLLKLGRTHFNGKIFLCACGNGSSELMTNLSSSIVNSLYNIQLMNLAGENGVAAFGTIMYVNFIFIAIFLGYSIGSAPLVSYHYGAGNHDELKNLFQKSLRLIGIWGLMLFILAQLIARPLAAIFVGYDADLFSMTQNGFRIYCIAYLINGFNIYGSSFFTALNNGLISAAISFLRTLVFQLAAVLLLPLLLDINGIWSAVAVAELLTLGLTVTFFVRNRKKYHYA
ncbi:MATE family efflux transporter [Roseburia sp. TF10-5]|uniref:MATE family efflux transporter n=1 Tax=Roseburia sp. TF10-5 TaxID=2293144 RepID=UPI000E53E2F4|nr:MATE family efflux transporter [Roseburia sp. TF10-5]RGI14362.1 MATE family efflux transporter [Roseburia sp. TF10-5]